MSHKWNLNESKARSYKLPFCLRIIAIILFKAEKREWSSWFTSAARFTPCPYQEMEVIT